MNRDLTQFWFVKRITYNNATDSPSSTIEIKFSSVVVKALPDLLVGLFLTQNCFLIRKSCIGIKNNKR